MPLQMAGFPSFLWPNNIPLYVYSVSSLPVQPLMDAQVISIPWSF